MRALENAALDYAQHGLYVFPLQPNGKTPLTAHGLDDATVDEMTIETWWGRWPNANIAIRTGDIVVVDEDRYGALDELAQSLGETIPETRIAQTASGRHFYFTQPDGQRVRNTAGRLAEGIDTRGDGGYVVGPPSVHPSGAKYSWLSEADIAPLPSWLAERLVRQQPERKPLPADLSLSVGTTPYGQRALDQEIEAVAHAAEGTRNHTLNTAAFALGQLVAGGEVDQHDAYRSLEAAADSAGLPRLEAEKTIRSGFSAGQAEPRSAPETSTQRPQLRVVREEPTSADPASGLFPTESWDDFSDLASAPTEFLVDDLWPVQSLGFIASPPKKGKTWLGLSLAISVASGVTFVGEFKVSQPRRVLYLALEGGRSALHSRLGCLARGMNVDPTRGSGQLDNLIISYRPRGIDLADEVWAAGLTEVVNENNVELVIVDVLRNAARIKEADASDFAHLRILLEETLKISSIALLHHFTKLSEISKERTPAERMSGSGAMYGALDVGMFITGSEQQARRLRVEFDGRDIAMPDPVSIYLEGDGTGPNGGFVFDDHAFWRGDIEEVQTARSKVEDSDVLAVLGDGTMKRKNLVAEVTARLEKVNGVSPRTVERHIDGMKQSRPPKLFDVPVDIAGEKGWYTVRLDLIAPSYSSDTRSDTDAPTDDVVGADASNDAGSSSATAISDTEDLSEQNLAQPCGFDAPTPPSPLRVDLPVTESLEDHPPNFDFSR